MTRPEWSRVELDDLRAPEAHSFVGGPFGSDLTQKDYIPEPGVPVLRGINLGGNESRFVDEGFVFVSEEKARSLSRNTAFRGDIVFTQRGTLGQVVIIPDDSRFERYVISQSQMKLTPDRQRVCPRFLYHYFRSPAVLTRLLGETLATGVPHINLGILKRFPVALPPLGEQQRIAAILDQADALRAKRRAALEKLDVLPQSAFLDLFGDPVVNTRNWPMSSLKNLGRVKTGGTPPTEKPGMFGGQIPFVTPGDLESDAPSKRTLTEDGAAEAETIRKGATLVCCIGATIGKMAQARCRSAFNQQINAIEWHDSIDDDYGLGALRFFKTRIARWGASTTLPILKKSSFEKIEIPVPPLDLQREFARRVQAIDALKAAQRRSLAKLDALFASLQHRAFRGEL